MCLWMLFLQIVILSKEYKGKEGGEWKKLNFYWYQMLKVTLMLFRQAQVGKDYYILITLLR